MISAEKFRALKQYIRTAEPSPRQRWKLWGRYLPVVLHLPDIFHIQWAKATEEWLFLKELFGVKLILSLRGTHINFSPFADTQLAESYRTVFPKMDGFHAVSKAIANRARSYGAPAAKIQIIYSGIDLTNARFSAKNPSGGNKAWRLLSVGRTHWVKGYHYALDALKLLKEAGRKFHYTIIAGGNQEEILYYIHDLSLKDEVSLLPSLPQEQVFRMMREHDLLLVPSVEEGIANVALEAMAIGLPVLSSNCGGMPEAIVDGVNGFLFRNRDTQDLAKQIEHFFALDIKERQDLVATAKRRIEMQFNAERLGVEMNTFYQMVLCASE